MRTLDLTTWPRRSVFDHYRDYAQPFFEVCARVEVTGLVARAKAAEESLFAALLFEAMRAVNDVAPLRQRIRGESVVEHDRVHPSFTVLVDDERFNFCHARFQDDRDAFLAGVAERARQMRGRVELALEEDVRDDMVFVTSLPWLDFTSIGHAMSGDPTDTIPRLAWGKIVGDGDRARVSVQLSVHHALVDGLHVARFFERLEAATMT